MVITEETVNCKSCMKVEHHQPHPSPFAAYFLPCYIWSTLLTASVNDGIGLNAKVLHFWKYKHSLSGKELDERIDTGLSRYETTVG